jgi:type IV secretion system protein TrbB
MTALAPRAEIERRLVTAIRQQLGTMVCGRLDDPQVIEIMLNPDGALWEDRLGGGMAQIGTMAPITAESFISTVASTLRASVTRDSPILECELPIRGARFEAMIPPVVAAPTFTIRLKAVRVFSLDDYVSDGTMTPAQRALIQDAVASRLNVLICGGTASGKTTLANAILAAMVDATPNDRLVILEDTVELQSRAQNVVALRATDTVDMQRLLRATMRLRPDRIIVGEVRGGEALSMLKAWNTGHSGGCCTVHANSAASALTRIEQLVAEVTAADMRAVIGEAIDLIVPIAKTAAGRAAGQLVTVSGFHSGQYVLGGE